MTLHLKVPSMACSACSDTITKAIKTVDPTAIVTADSTTKQVTVETLASKLAIETAIADAGYPVA